jgi:hypothetical protein
MPDHSLMTGLAQRSGAARPLARLSVTVPQDQDEPLRCALFHRLRRRVRWIALSSRIELGARQTVMEVVLEPGAVDEALHVIMTTASCARIGSVRRPAASMPATVRQARRLPIPRLQSAAH